MKDINLYKEYLNASSVYGESYCKMIGNEKEEVSEYFDFTQPFEIEIGDKMDYSKTAEVLDYHIYQIRYTLNESQAIQTLEMVYKSRNDLSTKSLLKTINTPKSEKDVQIIDFDDTEEIIHILFYTHKNNKRLVALSMKTNLGNVKTIGNTGNAEIKNNEKINNNRNIICGFGGFSGNKYGVSSIYCYYMDKNKYGIVLHNGLLQLRAKLKKDEKFREQLIEKKSSLNEKLQLILDVCDLPDTAFFPIATYIMSN